MNLQLLLPLLITSIVAIFGWIIAHHFTSYRDLKNKRLELRIKYLLEIYRRLERSVGQNATRTTADDLETALADLQLLGDDAQVEKASIFMSEFNSEQLNGLSIGNVLIDLRNSLRRDLGLNPINRQIEHLRIKVHSETE